MSREVVIRRARPGDAAELAPRLRAEDAAEVLARSGMGALEALRDEMDHASSAYAVVIDGEVAGLFGATPISALGGIGAAWFLGAPALGLVPLAMVKQTRAIVGAMLRTYPVLLGEIDLRYTAALRWALLVGFTLGTPAEITPGVAFVPIEARA